MRGVVLAAGEGTRLGSLTDDRPKALVEVADRPLLSYSLEALAETAVTDITVVVGYEGEAIVDHFGDSFEGIPLSYAWQREQKGLAHAMLAASDDIDETFVLVHGDYVFGQSLDPVIERHATTDPTATILVDEVSPDEATGVGVCEFDTDGALVGLTEKPDDPPSGTVVTGCFVFEPDILSAARVIRPSDRGEYELTDAIDLLVYAGHPVELVTADGPLLNVNTPTDRDSAAAFFQN